MSEFFVVKLIRPVDRRADRLGDRVHALIVVEHPSDVAFFGAVITVMTVVLNGLAVGLGVLFPNVKETNPNKIVSGFGGTLCFVLSSIYIIASLTLLVLGGGGYHSHSGWVISSIIAFIILSIVIGWLPMKLGLKQLKNFEV